MGSPHVSAVRSGTGSWFIEVAPGNNYQHVRFFPYAPEGKAVKNRLHIDIHSERGGLDELVARLEGLGATRVRELDKGPEGHWWIMQDPEGNEFCAT